jgi:hypothetical protein
MGLANFSEIWHLCCAWFQAIIVQDSGTVFWDIMWWFVVILTIVWGQPILIAQKNVVLKVMVHHNPEYNNRRRSDCWILRSKFCENLYQTSWHSFITVHVKLFLEWKVNGYIDGMKKLNWSDIPKFCLAKSCGRSNAAVLCWEEMFAAHRRSCCFICTV